MAAVLEQNPPTRSGRSAILIAVPPVVLALVAGALLLWGRSYPGYPLSVAALAFVSALLALVLARMLRPRGPRTVAVLAVVAAVLASGIGVTSALGNRPLHVRWSASAPDFEAYVAQLPAPSTFVPDENGATFHDFPAATCPAKIGRLRLSECWSVDGGYLFLQAPGALTDSSGIAYLPQGNNPETTGLNPSGLTPLGGPWWSWTCYC